MEAYVPQINLGELVKNQKNWDIISLSSFHPTIRIKYIIIITIIIIIIIIIPTLT